MKSHLFLIPVLLLIGCVAPSEFDDFGTTRSRSYSDKPFIPQGPLWPEGNKKGIDNVFDEIIKYQKARENKSLTSLQKQEFSFSKLFGREIFITTRVDDVGAYGSISGSSDTESWKPNSDRVTYDLGFILLNPIRYTFQFDSDSPDRELFKDLRKGLQINIKGKVKNIDTHISGGRDIGISGGRVIGGYAHSLLITIESSEFFEKPGAYY
jgi:hypothetical protein